MGSASTAGTVAGLGRAVQSLLVLRRAAHFLNGLHILAVVTEGIERQAFGVGAEIVKAAQVTNGALN
jgi:hypothetical protein